MRIGRQSCGEWLRRLRQWFSRQWFSRQWFSRQWFSRQPASLGERGELRAARYLRRKGLRIVARGHRDGDGELDLIAVDRRTVVFIEVKTRRSHRFGHPADAVDRKKQRQICQLADRYLKRHHLLGLSVRFDIVAVTWPAGQRHPRIEHFENAFDAPDPD